MNGYRPGDAVGVVDYEDVLYVATLPDGPIVVLDGISALIWDEACAGPRESIVERVAAATTAMPEAIRAHVERFVADLVSRGLLVKAADTGKPADTRKLAPEGARLPPPTAPV